MVNILLIVGHMVGMLLIILDHLNEVFFMYMARVFCLLRTLDGFYYMLRMCTATLITRYRYCSAWYNMIVLCIVNPLTNDI